MGKSKSAQPAKVTKSAKDVEVKKLSSVKAGGVTKPSQTPKSKSKDLAKQVATKSAKGDKKSKKIVKEPTPELSSDSESDNGSDAAMSSASSPDSDEVSDEEMSTPAAKANGVATNGVAKAAAAAEAETSESSDSSDSDSEAAPLAPAAVTQGKDVAIASGDSSDASEDSGAESDVESEADSSDDEAEVKPGAIDAEVLNGKLVKLASKGVCLILCRWVVLWKSDKLCRVPQTSLMMKILDHRTRTIQARKKSRKQPQPRSVRLMLSLLPSPRKRKQMLWQAVSKTQGRETSSSATCPGTWTKNG